MDLRHISLEAAENEEVLIAEYLRVKRDADHLGIVHEQAVRRRKVQIKRDARFLGWVDEIRRLVDSLKDGLKKDVLHVKASHLPKVLPQLSNREHETSQEKTPIPTFA